MLAASLWSLDGRVAWGGAAGVEAAGRKGHVQVTDWLLLALGMFADILLSP